MSTSKRSRRLLAGAATVPLLLGGLTLATAGPADAITCTHPAWSDRDKEGSGHGTNGSTPIHTGPAGSCGVTAYVGNGVLLWYHCYVVNSAGNTWTNVRIDGTQIVGWVWDAYLDDGGSFYLC